MEVNMDKETIIKELLKFRWSKEKTDEEYEQLLLNLYWSAHYDGMLEGEGGSIDV